MLIRVVRGAPAHVEAERFINMVAAVLDCLVGLEVRFVTFNLLMIPIRIVIGRIEIVVMAIPSDPMIEAETHFRCDNLSPRHAAKMPFADVACSIAISFEYFCDAGLC